MRWIFKASVLLSFLFLFGCSDVDKVVIEEPENPAKLVPPKVDLSFVDKIPNQNKVYIIETKRWGISTNSQNAVATTNGFQNAINWAKEQGYGKIKVPAGKYLIGQDSTSNPDYHKGIVLAGNMIFEMDQKAVLQMETNNKWNYCLLDTGGHQNIVITGGRLVGDRDTHIFTPRKKDGKTAHDEGHLICAWGKKTKNILIKNMHLSKASGDGILIVPHKGDYAQNILITENEITNNRRQGISILSAKDVVISKNHIHHIKGIAPQFGIDLESLDIPSQDVLITENKFDHNRGGDIVNTRGRNIWFTKNKLEQGKDNKYIDGPIVLHTNMDMKIIQNKITMTSGSANGLLGIVSYSSKKKKRTNFNTNYIIGNTCNNCGFYLRHTVNAVMNDNVFNSGAVSFLNVKNLTLNNNQINHKLHKWTHRFKDVTGRAVGNKINGEAHQIPLGKTLYSENWVK